ncbi:TetR/AcrR family transcriptional regulator [Aquisediminimonas sediminicola]|uniref:TetR/AcrR family transcriptional regulator n=1 Tax=Alteraquisediminimonas sediminicola TaxID=2676787 RepID=UPI001FEA1934|nr:TetR/AcrR family transcriptional regulator [Aquisediminimonas sediminicola]
MTDTAQHKAQMKAYLGVLPFERDPAVWLANSSSYVIPHQQRSRLALERIVAASLRLFAAKGFEATKVNEIALEAGVPIGTVYQRFADKSAILQTIIEGFRALRMREIRGFISAEQTLKASPAEVVTLHVNIIFSSFRTDAGLLRLIERRRLEDRQTHLDQSNANDEVAAMIADLLIAKLPDRAPATLRQQVFYLHSIIRGAVVWAALPDCGELGEGLQLSDPGFAAAALEMALAYLGLDDPHDKASA